MKKSNMNVIFSFILGALIFGGISAVFSYSLFANNVGYTPNDETWSVDNVKGAIDDLRGRIKTTLLWTNPSPTSAFGAQTIELDLSNYKTLLIETLSCFGDDLNDGRANAINVVAVGNHVGMGDGGSGDMRSVSVTTTGVTFGNAKYGQWDDNGCVLPYRIYGIKDYLYQFEN